TASADPSAKRIPRVAATPIAVLPSVPPPPPPASGVRNVRFEIIPKSGALTLDGSPERRLGRDFTRTVGKKEAAVAIKGRCSKERGKTVIVEPIAAGQPDTAQTIFLPMVIEPATVGLSGAPKDGQLACPALGLTVFMGGSKQVQLNDATVTTPCTFA